MYTYICSRKLLNIYWIILLSYVSNSMPTYFTFNGVLYASTNKRIRLFIGFHSIGVAIFFSDTISCVRELKHIASILWAQETHRNTWRELKICCSPLTSTMYLCSYLLLKIDIQVISINWILLPCCLLTPMMRFYLGEKSKGK